MVKTYGLLSVPEVTARFLLKRAAVKERVLHDMFTSFLEIFANAPDNRLNKFVVYGADGLLW